MALLETRSPRGKLDDTIPLKCTISGFTNRDGFTEFSLHVQRGTNPDNRWEVLHRYSDFAVLHSILSEELRDICLIPFAQSGYELLLPPKKVFGNMDSSFLQERRAGLQAYMNCILSNPLLANHSSVKKFLDPRNYSDELEKTAQQHAAMFFRSEANWELAEPLKDIGWRLRKHYFMIKSKDAAKNVKEVLTWVEHGPDMVLDHETSLLGLLRQLTQLQHPFIYPVTYASCTDKGSTIVRNFHPTGSLRDLVCRAKPMTGQLKKYGNVKTRVPLEFSDIKRCGRQILEALKFLHDKNWPYGHLHAGNVLVDGMSCRLLDVENGILGLSSVYRSYIMELRKVQDLEAIDVYSFGQLLYELTFGEPMGRGSIESVPSNCPPLIQPVLHSIVTTSALKTGLPTVSDLLSNPLFADISVSYTEKPSLKVNKLKESLKAAKEAIETRLKDDQKKLRQFQRLSKARSELLSEDEKKKRKKSAKKKLSSQEDRPKSPTSGRNEAADQKSVSPAPVPRSSVPAPPPPPPPPAAPPPPAQGSVPPLPSTTGGRGALLGSIQGFNKKGLKKAETNDRSVPRL